MGKRFNSGRQFDHTGKRPSCAGLAQSEPSRASTCGEPYHASKQKARSPVTSQTATPEPRVEVNQRTISASNTPPSRATKPPRDNEKNAALTIKARAAAIQSIPGRWRRLSAAEGA